MRKLTEGDIKTGKKMELGQAGGIMIKHEKKCKVPTKMVKW